MRGLFDYYGEDTDTPRLVATVTNMSEGEQSALSKWLHARYRNNGKVHRRIPCFVFDDHASKSDNCRDFVLTISNGTAFLDTRTALSPGQKVTMLFPLSTSQGPREILSEVIWISSKSLGT
jgi:hypothetical protein